ncbi:cytochrome c oxidase assembly protein [Microlunatus endophyticus]|uniref:Cytochrome c oxidase assembly protein n=2 Tax=Microlunatus endophyticus TaxID=1716077 RepID=A0A917W1R7_9ACTN|nr:cytochrome c oxidase assembly protein [Microlunatus endophyticus]
MIILLAGGYLGAAVIGVRRGVGVVWPAVLAFLAGLALYGWACFGFLGVYSAQLRWAFSTRIAIMLVVAPWLLGLGRPVAVAQAALAERGRAGLDRFLQSRPMRIVGFAGFEPLFTLAFLLVFLTPAAGFLRTVPAAEAGVSILVPLIGLLMVTPIAEDTRPYATYFVGLEFLIAFIALVADAIPGLVLRLTDTIYDGVASAGTAPGWFQTRLQDQHLSGDILWCLGEAADLPILAILFVRWARIDRRESKAVDDLSDEEFERLSREHLRQGR